MIYAGDFAVMFIVEGIGFALVFQKIEGLTTNPQGKYSQLLGKLPIGMMFLVTFILFATLALISGI